MGPEITEARNKRIWLFFSPETTALPTSQNWDYLTFGYYLVPSITCHHCLLCTWYDSYPLYTSPITHNKESQTHIRQHTALVVCETELRPDTQTRQQQQQHTHQNHHTSTTPAPYQQHRSKDSSRSGGDLTSPATMYVPDFENKGKRQNKTYQFQFNIKPLSKNQKPQWTPLISDAAISGVIKLQKIIA